MPGKGFKPGDVFIESLKFNSPRGFLDMTKIFMSAKIYESIFNPGVAAHIEIIDTEDYLGSYKVVGDEEIELAFLVPGGDTTTYKLNLHSLNDVETPGSTKAKIYNMVCLSKETFSVRANPVSKSYNTQISNIIEDVFKNFIGSEKNLIVEATKGIQKYIAPNIKPLDLIHKLRKRAVGMDNKSSNFVFFENQKGFNFKTIEGMFKESPIKYFKQEDTVGTSIYSQDHNNIISYSIPRQASSLDRVGKGALNHKVQTYDMRTKKYTTEDKKPMESDFGIVGALTSAFFRGMFGKTPGMTTFIQKDSMNPDTHLSDAVANKSAYLASLVQNQVNIEVPGDNSLHAGGTCWCDIPKRVSTTGMRTDELLVNGKFLIAKLAHIIKRPEEQPRYVVSMELLKDGYENGVS